jgi:membrane-bound lytic murein transglycosylase B
MSSRRSLRLGVFIAVTMVITACAEGARPEFVDSTRPSTTSTSTSTSRTTTTTLFVQPNAPSGRVYPSVPATAEAAAARLHEVEEQLQQLPPDGTFADLAHEQQMLYRVIGRNADWIRTAIENAPTNLALIVERHLAARQAISNIGDGGEGPANVPAWEIIEPLPAAELMALYKSAAEDTGIGWSFLAAINLIETGFGRINGLSTAGAQGPMQFLPTTWEEVSDGDIDDPHDAIPAAARYLVRRGGPGDMHNALWGYNNSDAYVAAVTHYANLFRDNQQSFLAAHAWEIHYSAAAGDLWLPVGYRLEEAQPAEDYLIDAPWSAPPPVS